MTVRQFPTERPAGRPLDPPAEYGELRPKEAIFRAACPAGIDAWVVTRYEDIRAMLADQRFSSRGAPSEHITVGANLNRRLAPGEMIRMDGPDHARLRRVLTPEFTVRQIETVRPYVRTLVEDHIDTILAEKQPVDLHRAFSLRIPSMAVFELLGVPQDDREDFHRWSAALTEVEIDRDLQVDSYKQMHAYLEQLVDARIDDPQEDLTSRLIQRGAQSDPPLTTQETAALGLDLLIAGHDTTAQMITLGVLTLLRQPDEMAKLRANPALASSAVEELLRYLTVVQPGILRYALDDVELGDHTIKAGDWVVAAATSGNRDEQAYPDADRVDVARPAKTHLSFGFGVHQCVGHSLVRVILQEIYPRLAARIPTLRLAVPFDELKFKHDTLVLGVTQGLPVTW